MQNLFISIFSLLLFMSCAGRQGSAAVAAADSPAPPDIPFSADSAYSFVARQVAFGPRVPNTKAHAECAEWLEKELRRHGASVIVQNADLKAFDGTMLKARNIFGQFRPEADRRILLLAHWDSRPWADQDPDPARRKLPVDGANDGASGVGVLLEIARQLNAEKPACGVDILFVDAEDWGTDGDENSWAMGARHFVENPPVKDYFPDQAILLDMVGGKGATFCREYFSEQAAPQLAQSLWGIAASRGYADIFLNRLGGAVTDDHVQLIRHGIPAVDIIEYHPEQDSGFNPAWHTTADNMDAIDPNTLKAVGETVLQYVRSL